MAAVEPVSAEAGAPTTHTQTPTPTSTRPVAPSPDHRDEKPSAPSPTRSGSFGSLFSDCISDPENGGDGDGDGKSKGARNNKAPPWRKYGSFNPLRWRVPPPVPAQRAISQEATAGLFSRTTFMWITDLMKTGYLRPLEPNDIPLVAPRRSATIITEKLQTSFRRRQGEGDKYPLLWALNEIFFCEFWFSGACRLVADVLLVINPFLLKYLIRFAVDAYNAAKQGTPGPSVGRGVGLACGITVIQQLISVGVTQFIYNGMMVGGQARGGIIGMIFDKSLKISGRARAGGDAATAFTMATARQQGKEDKKGRRTKEKQGKEEEVGWSNGRVVNLMGTDSYRVDQAAGWFHLIWTAPVQIVLSLGLLLVNLGYSALAGFALLAAGVPILSWVAKLLARRRTAMNKITDKRIALTQEILTGVRFVKYFGWEESLLSRLQELRSQEIRAVQFLLSVRSGVMAVGMSLPIFASMLAFVTYSLTDNSLDPANVFSSLALFNTLRLPLNLLPTVISQTIDAWVSIKRIQEYLLAEENTVQVVRDENLGAAIEVDNASFTWELTLPEPEKRKTKSSRKQKKLDVVAAAVEKEQGLTPAGNTTPTVPFHLEALNFSVSRHELLAVVGSVGSGKSSLLAALAGDMRRTEGSITMSANLAYCPQYAWIQNATVRENIVFGKDYDPEWYAAVVEACALQRDLDMLPDGDRTEIGERGITVSGGQKQRLNIARAIYFNADIVLMDDPLSAVDAHVGKRLFDKAICGLLKGKCRILATHQLHVLDKVDRVLWMEEGKIQAIGTYNELMQNSPGFAAMMREIAQESKEEEITNKATDGDEILEEEDEVAAAEAKLKRKTPAVAKALMQTEERAVSNVSWKVYEAYIKASGTILVVPALIILLLGMQVSNIWSTLWLGYWTSDQYSLPNGVYIGIFAALGSMQTILMFAFAFGIALAGTKSSRVLMQKAMKSTLRAPMSFFDTTPIGRMVNRFSKDVDVMDNMLTDALRMFLLTLSIISSVFILIIVYFPYFAIALFPLSITFLVATSYYRSSAREVKRHEAVLRSHVFARFGEALTGVASIRAYGLEDRFKNVLHKAVDEMNGAYFITFANQRWLSIRLDVIGNLLVFTTAILVVTSRFSIDPSIAGVVLSYILMIILMLQWMIRQWAEVENAMNATERIHFYGSSLPEEAPLRTNAQVPSSWPEAGTVEFKGVGMRYREGLPLVLKDLTLTIPGGSRVGVVGRTGAGKSSITSALFRLVELAEGTIAIDGVDISTLGLALLRSKLSIIPQDPTLFRGTIRSNLDPFHTYKDEELHAALRSSSLDSTITLESTVDEEGFNFSLGQRQQIALARALVRNSRVVVADEATSSVDIETDRIIQRSMKEGFKGRTLVCIAHRLRTVVGYDMIVVMDAGQVVEVGAPGELWRRGGVWRGMCDRSGISEADFEFSREG